MYESRRLILRKWTAADLSCLDAVLGDPIVMEFSDDGTLTLEEQEAWLQEATSPISSTELPGLLAIEHKKTGKVIGYVSLLQDLKRVSCHEAEIGFRLEQSAWGQGYASEAASIMFEVANKSASIARVVAIVDPNNHRSVGVLKKLGMTQEGEIMFDGYDYPDHIYARQCP